MIAQNTRSHESLMLGMIKRAKIVILMFFVSIRLLAIDPSPAGGQDHVTVSMQDAILKTLQLNPIVQVQKESVNQSRALADRSAGAFDWVVFGSAETYAEEDEDVSLNTSFGATKHFRNGIELTPSFSKSENSKISTRFIEQTGSIINVKILVPLLRGLGSQYTGAEEQSANFNWTASKYQSKHNISASVSKTASRFWECLGAMQTVEVLEDSERRGMEIVNLVRLLVEGGELNPVYLGEATGRYHDIKVDAGQGRLNLFRAQQALVLAMGDGPANGTSAPLAKGLFPSPIKLEDVSSALAVTYGHQALQKRGDYLASKIRIDAQDVLLQKARNNKEPRVDFIFEGGYGSVDETLYDSYSGPSYESLDGPFIQGKIKIELPLYNQFAQGEVDHRLSKKMESWFLSSQLENVILAEIAETIETLRTSIQEVTITRQSEEVYFQTVEQERKKLKAGAGNLSYLIDLEKKYTEARISQVQALQKYATALVRLRFVTGTILLNNEDTALFQISNLMELPTIQ